VRGVVRWHDQRQGSRAVAQAARALTGALASGTRKGAYYAAGQREMAISALAGTAKARTDAAAITAGVAALPRVWPLRPKYLR